MKKKTFEIKTERILYQRNVFSFLCIILSCVLVILSSFLFLKNERTVIVPAVIEKEFWIENKKVSATYLEQFGLFLGQLLLGKSSYSAPIQRQVLLRHTTAGFSEKLRRKLIEEENFLKTQNLNYTFFPIQVEVFPKTLKVVLTGDRITYVGSEKNSMKREGYELNFAYEGGRLLLEGITAKGENDV